MRATAISLSALIVGAGLLISVGAQAATTQGYPLPEATKIHIRCHPASGIVPQFER